MTEERFVRPWIKQILGLGPLVMDNRKSRARLFDVDLMLSENEYNALFLLAQRPNEVMTFEALYWAVWEASDQSEHRLAARREMDTVVTRINALGKGVVWITVLPDEAFVLKLQKHFPVM